MSLRVALLLMAVCVVGIPPTAAQEIIALDDDTNRLAIGDRVRILEDSTRAMEIEDARSPRAAARFEPSDSTVPNRGYSEDAYWVRFDVAQAPGSTRDWYFVVGSPYIEHIDVWFVSDDSVLVHLRGGTQTPSAERAVVERLHLFAVPRVPGAVLSVFARLQTSLAMTMPLELVRADQFHRMEAASLIPLWIYLGIGAALFFFNVVLFAFLRDETYLWYVLYIVSFTYHVATATEGIGYRFRPDGADWLEPSMIAASMLAALFIAQFTRSFLDTKARFPRMDRGLVALGVLAVVLAVVTVLSPSRVGHFLANGVAITFAPVYIAAGVLAVKKGFTPARYYLVAWTALLVGVIVFSLNNVGLLPKTFVTIQGMQIGSASEMILFSLALANRFNLIRKESAITKEKALEGEIHRLRVEELGHANEELRRANEAIVRQQEQLVQQEKLASLGQMTAGIAHEIKNPLNMINNFAELNEELAEELRETLERGAVAEALATAGTLKGNAAVIARQGRRVDAIVRSMMLHARSGQGERVLFDFNSVVDESVDLAVHGRSTPGGVGVERELDPSVGAIDAVPQDVGRVVTNLVSNSIDALLEKSTSGDGPFEPVVRVSTLRDDTSVELRVRDNGPGIPAELRQRIFEPFFTTKPTGTGNTGLGLSLSFDIVVKGHGGTFEVDSEVGLFTEFRIRLPIERETET